jgi:hypothetical protein
MLGCALSIEKYGKFKSVYQHLKCEYISQHVLKLVQCIKNVKVCLLPL